MTAAFIKSSFNQVLSWLRLHWLLASLLTAVIVLLWGASNWQLMQQVVQANRLVSQLSAETQRQQQQLQDSIRHRDFLQTELSVEKNTNLLLQDDIKQQQAEIFELKKQLAGYQQIVTPVPAAGSLVIESFQLTKDPVTEQFRFKLALIDQNKQQQLSRAELEIWLTAVRNKRKVQHDILKLAGFKTKDKRLQVQNIYRVEGAFSLPLGLQAQQIEIRLTVPTIKAGQSRSLRKTIDWDGISEILD